MSASLSSVSRIEFVETAAPPRPTPTRSWGFKIMIKFIHEAQNVELFETSQHLRLLAPRGFLSVGIASSARQ